MRPGIELALEIEAPTPILPNLRPIVADEETIILRKLEASESAAAGGLEPVCLLTGELVLVLADEERDSKPHLAACSITTFSPFSLESRCCLSSSFAPLVKPQADCEPLPAPTGNMIEFAFWLEGKTGLALASQICIETRSKTSPQTSKLGLTMNSIKPDFVAC